MDYKYIEQLLERYWECATTLEEEAILRAFFSQDDVPESLSAYRDLFVYELSESTNNRLGEEFDSRITRRLVGNKPVPARRVSLVRRLRPLYKAAAIVAILLTLGNAVEMSIDNGRSPENIVEAVTSGDSAIQVARADSIEVDTIHHTSLAPQELTDINQIAPDNVPIN
ncbi:MAG: pyruvate ferredoxin oxidoreductase [Prevotella sp.]|nr:pyruvate ferredoxin oxidoreductase [Prevotella sp.]